MKVTVRLLSGADHLSQILTGFQMLSRENKLTLDILDCRKDSSCLSGSVSGGPGSMESGFCLT